MHWKIPRDFTMALIEETVDTPSPAQRVAVDTNVIVGTTSQRDSQHAKAAQAISSAVASGVTLVYFDCVITEAISVLARRAEEQKRSDVFSSQLDVLFAQAPVSSWVRLFPKIELWFDDIIALMRQTTGQLNFNDALIVVACRELGITTLLSFDADFDRIEGLTRLK